MSGVVGAHLNVGAHGIGQRITWKSSALIDGRLDEVQEGADVTVNFAALDGRSYRAADSFFFLLEHVAAIRRSPVPGRSHLLLTIFEGMSFAQASARLRFGRSEHYELFKVVGPPAGGRE